MSFKAEYNHWIKNREHYKGIHPDHENQRWEISVMDRGNKLSAHVGTLNVAKQAINRFHQSAGRG